MSFFENDWVPPAFPNGISFNSPAFVHQKVSNILFAISEFGKFLGVCTDRLIVSLRNRCIFGDGEAHRCAEVCLLGRQPPEGIPGTTKVAGEDKANVISNPSLKS